MYYLNTHHLQNIPRSWNEIITVIQDAIEAKASDDFAQPIKPYLRYGEAINRIIAMPAYIGGKTNKAGIKWIASFPKNPDKGIRRANSVTILNNAQTGEPTCIINSAMISSIRTAAVSGLLVRKYLELNDTKKTFSAGIIGFGPIGRMHFEMLTQLLGNKLERIYLYDLKKINIDSIPEEFQSRIVFCDSYNLALEKSDIFITATVSSNRYIDNPPKENSLQLNVSLRDYKPNIIEHVDTIIVDDWEEVCRENTDIEAMHKVKNLNKEDTYNLEDIFVHNKINEKKDKGIIMFNPMGMAIFDIATANYFYSEAYKNQIGISL